eukprot:TRINITY_DN4938_c0_g1_i8.p1 TRINITY_DN4938_c0_g1~~TRINITY_DN4938_c0_g1_i8.p1  ORF type:complete len:346 (+),score=57.47 TRINITY_DN4938_c0_g1_i8:83-1120(+)
MHFTPDSAISGDCTLVDKFLSSDSKTITRKRAESQPTRANSVPVAFRLCGPSENSNTSNTQLLPCSTVPSSVTDQIVLKANDYSSVAPLPRFVSSMPEVFPVIPSSLRRVSTPSSPRNPVELESFPMVTSTMRTVSPRLSPAVGSPVSTPPNLSPRISSLTIGMVQTISEEDTKSALDSLSQSRDCIKRSSTHSDKQKNKFRNEQEHSRREQVSVFGRSSPRLHQMEFPRISSPKNELVQPESMSLGSYSEDGVIFNQEMVQEETNEPIKRTITIKLKKETSRRGRVTNQGKTISTSSSTFLSNSSTLSPQVVRAVTNPGNTGTDTPEVQPLVPTVVELLDASVQ